MVMKRVFVFLFLTIFLLSFVVAQEYKIEVATTQEAFEAGETITLRVSLLDSNNNPIYDEVSIILEDSSKNRKQEIIQSNELVSIDFEQATFGQGIITANYQESTSTSIFFINANEDIEFELGENVLIITNTGNTKYTKPFQISIGDYIGKEQNFDLIVGESQSFKLVAPEGTYTLKVIVDGKVLFSKNDVPLASKGFTGEAIGAIDESASKRSGLTGGISPDEESHEAILGYLKNSKLTYIFVLVIFGTMILLAIERRYKKKISK